MIARKDLPPRYAAWNRAHRAPNGRRLFTSRIAKRALPEGLRLRLGGCFACQYNNPTRAFEYPWAAEEAAPAPGQRVVDLGGGLCGLQFVLSRLGCDVVNVDPGEASRGRGWPCTPESVRRLNRLFGTRVRLLPAVLQEADLEPGSVDTLLAVSVLEHLPADERPAVARRAGELLRPGGRAVVTTDLFLDLHPFTPRRANRWGGNVDVAAFAAASGLRFAKGEPSELFGFPAFSAVDIQSRLEEFLVGRVPSVVECFVLERPAGPGAAGA